MVCAEPRGRRRHTFTDQARPDEPTTIDLHAHTRRSDGLLEPAALVAAAASAGVRLFSLTDHDTLAGYREVVAAGQVPPTLELVPGVEINAIVGSGARAWEGEIHVLGFGMDPDDDEFESVLATQRAARRVRFQRMLTRLRELDLAVDDALDAGGTASAHDIQSLGRPTIARALMAKGHAASVEDAFDRLLARGRPAHIARDGLDPIEAVEVIRRAGGLPSLAHFAEAPSREGLVRELIDAGLGGLEVYYQSFDRPTVANMAAFARRSGLVATGGSDYHGDLGSYVEAHAALWIPSEAAAPFLGALGRVAEASA